LAILSLGDINAETWSSRLGVGCKDDDLALQKKNDFCEIQRSENRMKNLAKSSKEGYGSKRAVLPMIMIT
jgi:hypothetical protein